MWLWRLISIRLCSQEAGDSGDHLVWLQLSRKVSEPGEVMVWFQSMVAGFRPRKSFSVLVPVQRQENLMFQLEHCQVREVLSYSIQALN